MLKQKKIKVLKLQNRELPHIVGNPQTADRNVFLSRELERNPAARVNDRVSDWRNQKRADEISAAAFLSK
jgi:hypothetical protein